VRKNLQKRSLVSLAYRRLDEKKEIGLKSLNWKVSDVAHIISTVFSFQFGPQLRQNYDDMLRKFAKLTRYRDQNSDAQVRILSAMGVTAKGESFLATYSNDCKRSIEERFELLSEKQQKMY